MIPECDSISASVPVTRVLSCPVIMERGVIWREGFTFITWLPVVDQQEGRKAGRTLFVDVCSRNITHAEW